MGRLSRAALTPWQSWGGQRILVVAPHPDDEIAGCAGTLLHHLAAGDEVCILFVTDGGSSRALGLNREEMVRRRHLEAAAVVRASGVSHSIWMGLPEGNWQPEQFWPQWQSALAEWQPQMMYVPSRIDFHPEHHQAAYALSRNLPDEMVMRVYQIQVPLTAVLSNIIINVSQWSAQINQLIHCYHTQRQSLAAIIRPRQYAAQYYGQGQLIEPFWQMNAAAYKQLHQKAPTTWSSSPFRGLRYRSFADPLAYVQGKQMRQGLSVQAFK